ncbi:unnamed protein product [Paramecium pentaurelia]|uniref:Cyclic nucleotide-binding domain-containing protein n=1 Tax=Paramecium pentaurelia TaxID=43138 RepID=A0A8S1Y735_9CILI|nr:unnamed protein product [Paramecium pentaurelia]
MNSTRNDNLETKYFDDNQFKENQPMNTNKVTSRGYQSNILQSLAIQGSQKKKFNSQKRDIYVQKFMKNMQSGNQKIKQLNKLQLQMINDKASSQKTQIQKKSTIPKINGRQQLFLNNLKNSFKKKLDRVPILYPYAKFKILWDAISVLTRLYFTFVIPLDLGWQQKSFIFYDFQGISIISLLFIIFDLILSLNTAYYKDGQLVTNRIMILKHSLFNSYGLQWFTVFLLILFFFISISEEALYGTKSTFSFLILILFLVHFKPIITIVNYYEETLNFNKQIQSILELVKLLFVLFYSIHFFSCIWMLVGNYSITKYNKSWVLQSGVEDAEWQIQYLQSFYYSAVTMFTIGYGDVTPQSSAEKVLAVTYIIAASIQLPYSVNTLGTIIQQISVYTVEKKRKLRIISTYLTQQKISQDLQIQIREYLTFRWENQQVSKNDEVEQLIAQLSTDLKDSLVTESYKQILNKCSLFSIGFSEEFRASLVKFAKEIALQPEQELHTDDSSQNNLYYIISGELQIQHSNGLNLGTLVSGQSIGLNNFITSSQKPEKYRSVGFSKLICLEQKYFLKLLQEYPEDYEKYCQIKDSMLFTDQNQELLPQTCFSCNKKYHSMINCPKIHYVPDKEKILKSFTFPNYQKRTKFNRRIRIMNFLTQEQVIEGLKIASQQLLKDNPEIVKLYSAEYLINEVESAKQSLSEIQPLEQSSHYSNEQDKTPEKQQYQKINKFKQAVHKIISINNEYSQYITFHQIDPKKSKQLLQNTLTLRLKVLDELKSSIFKKEQDLIQYVLQLNNMDYYFDKSQFESALNYKNYYPNDNYKNLFKEKQQKRNLKLLRRLALYFLQPCNIIDQFKLTNDDISPKLCQRRKNLYFSVDLVMQ